jgi:hypothetical protein
MDTVSQLGYTISGIVYSIVFILGAAALYNKDKLYGGKMVILPILFFSLITICFGSGLIYILYAYLQSDDPVTQQNGIKYFVAVAGTLLLLGGIFTGFIIRGQGILNVEGFNLFSSFLILEFSVMVVLTVIISKVWTLNT